MKIVEDDLSGGDVIGLLEEHLADMYATSPPESVHALDIDELKSIEITFYSGWINSRLAGCIALKHISNDVVELKSMRTSQYFRNQGVGAQLLDHVFNVAKQRGYVEIKLETGTQNYFSAARNLYKKHGFVDAEPFSHYSFDPNSCFMKRTL